MILALENVFCQKLDEVAPLVRDSFCGSSIFTESAHWADSVLELWCLSVCDVCLSVCPFVPSDAVFIYGSHWPWYHMISSQAYHWSMDAVLQPLHCIELKRRSRRASTIELKRHGCGWGIKHRMARVHLLSQMITLRVEILSKALTVLKYMLVQFYLFFLIIKIMIQEVKIG